MKKAATKAAPIEGEAEPLGFLHQVDVELHAGDLDVAGPQVEPRHAAAAEAAEPLLELAPELLSEAPSEVPSEPPPELLVLLQPAQEPVELFAASAEFGEDAFRASVAAALAELPEEQRAVVHLKIWEDLTFAEIAEALGISANTAASRYRYALDKLEGLLRPLCEP